MRRLAILLALGLALAGSATAAGASVRGVQVNHTPYEATGLDGHPQLRHGGVLDLTFGRELGAVEWHRVRGAAPDTAYDVAGEIFFASACADDDPFGPVTVPEGVLETDGRGAGTFFIRFPGEAFADAPDTFWVRWTLSVDGQLAYRSGCVRIDLGA